MYRMAPLKIAYGSGADLEVSERVYLHVAGIWCGS